ncbi:MAG: ABC transporter ATP-binding protein [Verrucomicrobia bacterium]|nr:ABC transporter ATP-binding protein [Verrucomicrobiota bacterium]
MTLLLNVDDLHVHFLSPFGTTYAVNGVSFSLHPGDTLALVGESGCGKSVTALAIMGLLPTRSCQQIGSIQFQGAELIDLPKKSSRLLRRGSMGMIFQDPMTALNPTMRIGEQIAESARFGLLLPRKEAKGLALDLLERVEIPSSRFYDYPYQLSGGQRQRILIAIAIAANPKLIIADEPTTALDVTVQGHILELLRRCQEATGAALLLITHDLGVVAEMANRVVVMYAGKVVEEASVEKIFSSPTHPYTCALLESMPDLDRPRHRLPSIPGSPPSLRQAICGCPFAPRCPHAMPLCREKSPPGATKEQSACWLYREEL